MPLPFGPSSAGISSRVSESEESCVFRPSVAPCTVFAPTPVDDVAAGSNAPVTDEIAPWSTIGRCLSYGYAGYSSSICSLLSLLVISERSISSCMLPRRSQAIAFSQATESTGVHLVGL